MKYPKISFLFLLFSCGFFTSFISALFDYSQGSCVSFPSSTSSEGIQLRLVNPCVDYVNYPFYLHPGESLQDLTQTIHKTLNNTLLLQMPQTCLTKVVAFNCAKVYLKCKNGVDLSNTTTYNYQIYSHDLSIHYGVPFQRPCLSVCSAVNTGCTGSLYSALIGPAICNAIHDYSSGDIHPQQPTRFDTTNNAATCYTITNFGSIGTLSEPYQNGPTAPCSGFFPATRNVFIPPATKLNASLTLLQRPGTVQSLINQGLYQGFQNLPDFFTPECRFGMEEYICRTKFLFPKKETLKQAMLNSGITPSGPLAALAAANSFLIPEYPTRDVCYTFNDRCSKVMPRIVTKNPNINPDCDQIVDPVLGTHFFPLGNQTVAAVKIPVGTVRFFSGPNDNVDFNATAFNYANYEPSCPTGYVIPDHPDEEGIKWITGTSCAMSCLSPFWTPDEWDRFHMGQKGFAAIGTILGFLFLFFLIAIQSLKDTYPFVVFTILSLIASINGLSQARYSQQDAFCHDNAVEARDDHGQPLNDSCVNQAGILVYTYIACCAIMVVIAIDWRIKLFPAIEREVNRHKYLYHSFQFFIGIVLPFIPVIVAASLKVLGASRAYPWCFVRVDPFGPKDIEDAIVVIPILVIALIYLAIFVGMDICGLAEKPPAKPEATPHDRALHMATAVTIVLSLIIFIPFVASKGSVRSKRPEYLQSLTDWTQCVFANYRAATPNSCFDVCGSHPPQRPRVQNVPSQLVSLTGNMLIICPSYVVAYFVSYYFYKKDYVPIEKSEKEGGEIEIPSGKSEADLLESSRNDPESHLDDKPTTAVAEVEVEMTKV